MSIRWPRVEEGLAVLDAELLETVRAQDLIAGQAVVVAVVALIRALAHDRPDVAEAVELSADLADFGGEKLVVVDQLIAAEGAAGWRAGSAQGEDPRTEQRHAAFVNAADPINAAVLDQLDRFKGFLGRHEVGRAGLILRTPARRPPVFTQSGARIGLLRGQAVARGIAGKGGARRQGGAGADSRGGRSRFDEIAPLRRCRLIRMIRFELAPTHRGRLPIEQTIRQRAVAAVGKSRATPFQRDLQSYVPGLSDPNDGGMIATGDKMGLFERDKSAERVPVTLLTGFLGSGKTTLLNHLLGQPAFNDTAVIINEFGAVSLDHLLVEAVSGEVLVLEGGCICCAVRSDLETTLRDLLSRRRKGDLPPFRRVVVETTGLADPAPILQLLLNNPLVSGSYGLDGVVTTVDGLLGAAQLTRHPEAAKQVAVADRLVLTKRDIAGDGATAPLSQQLDDINPVAPPPVG